jgi:hypothetical protein
MRYTLYSPVDAPPAFSSSSFNLTSRMSHRKKMDITGHTIAPAPFLETSLHSHALQTAVHPMHHSVSGSDGTTSSCVPTNSSEKLYTSSALPASRVPLREWKQHHHGSVKEAALQKRGKVRPRSASTSTSGASGYESDTDSETDAHGQAAASGAWRF